MSRICIPVPASTYITGVPTAGSGGSGAVAGGVPTVNVLRTEPNITTLTGGTSTALNGIVTNSSDAYPTNVCVFLPSLAPAPALYQLKAGNDPENIPFVVWPVDRSVSNAKVWIQRL
jgi:hypothetical protein